MNFEEFKRLEFLGDSLLRFISCEVICTDYSLRTQQRNLVYELGSNKVLAKIAMKLSLEPHALDVSDEHDRFQGKKPYANSLEAKMYMVFQEEGMEGAKKWFIENILNNYKEMNSEFAERFDKAKK